MFMCAHCKREYETFPGIICTECARDGWCLRCGNGKTVSDRLHHCAACHAA